MAKFVEVKTITAVLKRIFVVLYFCIRTIAPAAAQDIYFCGDYTPKGEATDATKTWNLDEKGKYVYILFTNNGKRIKSKSIVMNLLKQSSTVYKSYEKRAMKMQNENTFAVLDYQFIDSGNYEVIIKDIKGKELASNYLTITLGKSGENNVKSSTDKPKNTSPERDPDRDYYHAKMIFCRSVSNGIPVDSGLVFQAGEFNVMVMNDKALATDSMIIDVLKKGFETEKYPIYVTSKNFRIDGSLNKAWFSLSLSETGEYKIVSYNRRSQTISEGYITIR